MTQVVQNRPGVPVLDLDEACALWFLGMVIGYHVTDLVLGVVAAGEEARWVSVWMVF
jgi:hypothetical protein